eukprot:603280-Rhodomonas_salina.1
MVKFGLIVPLIDVDEDGTERVAAPYCPTHLLRQIWPCYHQALLKEAGDGDSGGGARISAGDNNVQLTCFLAFATDETMPTWERKQHVTMEQVAREGFYPSGNDTVCSGGYGATGGASGAKLRQPLLRPTKPPHKRVHTGRDHGTKLAASTGNTTGADPQGTRRVREEPTVQCPSTSRRWYQVSRLWAYAYLIAMAVLTQGYDGTRQGGYEEYDGSLVVLYGAKGLQEVEGRGDAMFIGVGQRVEATELRYRFQLFLPPRGLRDSYDVFLSYR